MQEKIDIYAEVCPDERNLVSDTFSFRVHIRTLDLLLGDSDASDMDIGPSCELTRWLADTTTSVQASHTWLDSHGHELVMVMSSQRLSNRLFVIKERSKVELLVP